MKPSTAEILDALADLIADRVVERVVERLGTHAAGASSGPAAMRFADAAKHLGLSVRYLHAQAANGMPTIGSGRARRVDVAAALQWMRREGDQKTSFDRQVAPALDPELAGVAELAAERAKRRRKAVR